MTPAETLWKHASSAAGGVSIRVKIMGIVVAIILLLGAEMTWVVRSSMYSSLAGELEEQGVSIARDVSARATDLILTNNSYALFELLRDTTENNKDIRYILVMDHAGSVLVHTLGSVPSEELISANWAGPGERSNLAMLDTEEGVIRDIAVPIFEGRAGVVRLGLSDRGLKAAVSAATDRLLLATFVSSLAGFIAAYLLTSVLSKPIRELVEAARAVAHGDLGRVARVHGRDEIGQLGKAFNAMTAELSEKEELRSQLLVKVMAAQEEERKRIARELHDETSQCLTSLIVGLKVLEKNISQGEAAGLATMAAELRTLTAKTLEAVHGLAVELRPSVLDDLGLVAAVERYVRDYARRHGCQVDLQTSDLEGMRLPPQTELAVYRIVQEALTNTAKYAEASSISVTLERRDGTLVGIIEDDGKGFDVGELLKSRTAEKKLGLFGMQERASLVGGKLAVESEPGAGTTIYVEAPLISSDSALDATTRVGATRRVVPTSRRQLTSNGEPGNEGPVLWGS